MGAPFIKMQGIVKKFPGVVANDHIDLDIYLGEIHALLGENGSGKSTLMSVLAGLYKPTAGKILINGVEKKFGSPRDAIANGIGMVHQHFKLVEPLTVAENITMAEREGSFWLKLGKYEHELIQFGAKYGLSVNPSALVWQLSVGEKQRVEILRILYQGSQVLILDEPTAVLTPQETCELFENLRTMANEGCAVIFITHKLNEVQALADRVTVLRGGKVTGVLQRDEIETKRLVRLMVGRDVVSHYDRKNVSDGQIVLEIDRVNALNDMGLPGLNGLSLVVREGEILGLAGVAGNGQRELAEVIAGLRKTTMGTVRLRGEDVTNLSPLEMIRRGVGYVPEDRMGMGLIPELNITDNLVLKCYQHPRFSGRWLLNNREIYNKSTQLVEQYQVKIPSLEQPIKLLSGGNMQRLLLAREIANEPKLMVVVYPVRGLDVGATEAVHKLLLELRLRRTAILLISEDLDEIFKLADRVGVLSRGQVVGDFNVEDADVEEIGLLMAGSAKGVENDVCPR